MLLCSCDQDRRYLWSSQGSGRPFRSPTAITALEVVGPCVSQRLASQTRVSDEALKQPDLCKERESDQRNSNEGECVEQFEAIGARFDIVALSLHASRVAEFTFEIATSIVLLVPVLIFDCDF